MNGRKFTRVSYSAGAAMMYDDTVVACCTDNLSIHGMFLKTEHEIPTNASVHVTVHHSSQSPLKVNARVVRKEANGIGLQIHNLDVSSFAKLRDIVVEINRDYVKVLTETLSMLKCIC